MIAHPKIVLTFILRLSKSTLGCMLVRFFVPCCLVGLLPCNTMSDHIQGNEKMILFVNKAFVNPYWCMKLVFKDPPSRGQNLVCKATRVRGNKVGTNALTCALLSQWFACNVSPTFECIYLTYFLATLFLLTMSPTQKNQSSASIKSETLISISLISLRCAAPPHFLRHAFDRNLEPFFRTSDPPCLGDGVFVCIWKSSIWIYWFWL